MISWYWRNNYLFAILAIELCLCRKLDKKKYAVISWFVLFTGMLVVSSYLMQNWQWTEGHTVASANILNNVFWRTVLSLLSALQLYLCYQISAGNALYIMAVAGMLQRILFDIYKIVEAIATGTLYTSEPSDPVISICLAVLAVGCVISFIGLSNKRLLLFRKKERNTQICVCALLLIVVMDANETFLFVNDPYVHIGATMIVVRCNSILVYIMTVAVLYSLTIQRALEMEHVATETLSRQRAQQYESSRQLMQLINIKSHDLKKQLRYLETSAEGKSDTVAELKQVTAAYDTIIDTNNEALSTVLSEKSATCQSEKIPFTVMSSNETMDFMRDIDIYTLFANLLDNAIEASRNVELDHRSITLSIKAHCGFVSIHEENYFSDPIKHMGENLLTTKGDTMSHGFGYQSMQQIVEQYHGTISHKVKEDVFAVNILLPLPEGTVK